MGKRDELRGLKENVIVGRLIPAGTGMAFHEARKAKEAMDESRAPRDRAAGGRGAGGRADGRRRTRRLRRTRRRRAAPSKARRLASHKGGCGRPFSCLRVGQRSSCAGSTMSSASCRRRVAPGCSTAPVAADQPARAGREARSMNIWSSGSLHRSARRRAGGCMACSAASTGGQQRARVGDHAKRAMPRPAHAANSSRMRGARQPAHGARRHVRPASSDARDRRTAASPARRWCPARRQAACGSCSGNSRRGDQDGGSSGMSCQ